MPGLLLPQRPQATKPVLGGGVGPGHPLAAKLVQFWALGEGGGGQTWDSASGATGTLQNAPAWSASPHGVGLKLNGAYDTTGQYITIPVPALGTANATLAAWVHIPSTTLRGPFIKVGDSSSGYGIGVGNTQWGDDNTTTQNGNNVVALYEGKRWIAPGVAYGTGPHHVALVIDGSGYPTIYLDGKKIYSDTTGAPLAPTNAATLGGYAATIVTPAGTAYRMFGGTLISAGIWSRALSAAEIQSLYTDPYGLLAKPRRTFAVSSTIAGLFAGSGGVTGAGTTLVLGSGTLAGTGALAGSGVVLVRPSAATFAGAGTVSGTSVVLVPATATTIAGTAALAGSATILASGAGVFGAAGRLSGAASVIVTGPLIYGSYAIFRARPRNYLFRAQGVIGMSALTDAGSRSGILRSTEDNQPFMLDFGKLVSGLETVTGCTVQVLQVSARGTTDVTGALCPVQPGPADIVANVVTAYLNGTAATVGAKYKVIYTALTNATRPRHLTEDISYIFCDE